MEYICDESVTRYFISFYPKFLFVYFYAKYGNFT